MAWLFLFAWKHLLVTTAKLKEYMIYDEKFQKEVANFQKKFPPNFLYETTWFLYAFNINTKGNLYETIDFSTKLYSETFSVKLKLLLKCS